MRIVTPMEMQELERRFMEESGVTSATLMGRAADGMLEAVRELMGPGERRRALVMCGPGANGGDGWALAWRLAGDGWVVRAVTCGAPREGTAAHENYLRCLESGADGGSLRVTDLAGRGLEGCEDGAEVLRQVSGSADAQYELCVDALFGTGLSRPPQGLYRGMTEAMRLMAMRGARVVAADIPSGLDGLTGADGGACPADVTVTFQYRKRGQLLGQGQDLCGRLVCHDIGIPGRYAPADAPEYLTIADVNMPRRRHDSHKGSYGHLLLVAGSTDYAGAAILAARSALRAGVGLLTTGCVDAIRPLLQVSAPAGMAMALCAGEYLDGMAADNMRAALRGKSAVAIGPGLTREASPALIARTLDSSLPAVLDADALNILSGHPRLRAMLAARHVLTPHPGEMARLLGRPCVDPVEDARALARECGCVVLLKGAATCVTDGATTYFMAPGTPGMACGGSGDVLTGVIGALLAQGVEPLRAAAWGALLHGQAGLLAAQELGEIAMNAADLIDRLPGAFRAAERG